MRLYLHAPWGRSVPVRAVMTTRLGGLAGRSPFEGFNLGLTCGDDPDRVAAHWRMVAEDLGLADPPRLLTQVHGADLADASAAREAPAADGWLLTERSRAVAVQVADCLPIALVREDGGAAALIHAGWKGLAAGIVQRALEALRGRPVGAIQAWVGPGIDGWAYEVGPEVRSALTERFPASARHFHPSGPDRWRVGLGHIAEDYLRAEGCRVWRSAGGTWSRPDLWYSWRRGQPTGRQAMVLWIPDEPSPL